MKCKEAFELMSLYFDNEIEETDKIELFKHISNCEQCKADFDNLEQMINSVNNLPLLELPENFHSELMEKIKDENKVISFENKIAKKAIYKKYMAIAVVLFVLIIVGGNVFLKNNINIENSQLDVAYSSSSNGRSKGGSGIPEGRNITGNSQYNEETASLTSNEDSGLETYSQEDENSLLNKIEGESEEKEKENVNYSLQCDESASSSNDLYNQANNYKENSEEGIDDSINENSENYLSKNSEIKREELYIKNYFADIYTNNYENTLNNIKNYSQINMAVIESEEKNKITIKVPREYYDNFIKLIYNNENVKNDDEVIDDITDEYENIEVNFQSELKNNYYLKNSENEDDIKIQESDEKLENYNNEMILLDSKIYNCTIELNIFEN